MVPGFEEKSFEAAANGELRLTSPQFYAPGQVAEGILGFDVASLQPATAPVWNYLQMAAPGGLRLVPNLWPAGNQPSLHIGLPSYVVSLIVQYKRAEHMWHPRSGQYSHWGTAYYRFKVDPTQQSTLAQFENAVSGHALVRYGSPAFHRFDDLEQHTLNTRVLANTNFVRPSSLIGHQAWTYIAPGTVGYANAQPELVRAENWAGVQGALLGARREMTVLKHLRDLASGIIAAGLVRQAQVPAALDLPSVTVDPERRQGLADLLTVGQMVGRTGSDWWLSVEPATKK